MSRIVHLGLGNFHRAHQALYTAQAGDGWEITGVAHHSRHVVDALRRQRMRYTVLTLDGTDVGVEPVDVITEALVGADEPERVVQRLADPVTEVVTLTITEAGYVRGGDMLDLLRQGLHRRGGAPVTVVCCDNLAANGGVLERLLPGFDGVAFPSTMVDRIVPRTTAEHVEFARRAGYDDAVPVPAEPFRQWVVQPRFAAGRPAWERAGVHFSDDVAAWERVKVRLLNGTHSLVAYLGLLRGHVLVADAIADDAVRAAADAVGDEYAATLRGPQDLDLAAYRAQLGHRFANRALGHRTEQVASDGSGKLRQRIPEPAGELLARGRPADALALTVAAFLQCWRPGVVLAGAPTDQRADILRALHAEHHEAHQLTRHAVAELFGEMDEAFVERAGDLLDVLHRAGTDAAIEQVLTGASTR